MNIVKSSLITVFVLVGALSISQSAFAGPSASSYDLNVTCGSFVNDQNAAQDYFDTHGLPVNLDQNGDSQACADPSDGDFTSTGPSAGLEGFKTTCDSFNNDQKAAQSYFDANGSPANLDQDGDGIACNDIVLVYETPEAVAPVSEDKTETSAVTVDTLPNTGVGTTSSATITMPAIIAVGLALITCAAASTVSARRS
ncbi:MAG: hypothetical protein ACR2OU_19170 [Thermomicrobiales bacterium]